MRIAFIGKFDRIHDEEGKARSFEKLGHEVLRFDEDSLPDLGTVFNKKPDIVTFAKLKIAPPLRQPLIETARQLNIPTVCWNPDLYWGFSRQFLVGNDPIFRATLVLTPDGGSDEEWAKKGVNHKVLRQAIYDEDCFIGEKGVAPAVIFVGTFNPGWEYRTDLIRFLQDKVGPRFTWYGRKGAEEVRGSKLNDLYASTKVVVGDSVAHPRYWSNRIYETIGRGGFIIHPMTPGLDEEFTPYKHFVPYKFGDMDGLLEKINYFLEHDEEREAIAKAGMEHVKTHHTLLNRCQEFIDIVTPYVLRTSLD